MSKRSETRIQIRLSDAVYDRIAKRATERGYTSAHDFARDRVLGRLRPTLAQRSLAKAAPDIIETIRNHLSRSAAASFHAARWVGDDDLKDVLLASDGEAEQIDRQLVELLAMIDEATHR